MKPFTSLTLGGQVRRLRLLGARALEAFPLTDARIHRKLFHGENTTFEVRASDGRGGEDRYVLRIHRHGYHDAETIRDELAWLDALARDTDLTIPAPVSTRDGALLCEAVTQPGVPNPRTVTLVRWVDGQFARHTKASPAQIRSLGRLMSALHEHARHWAPARTLRRPRWDADGLASPASPFGDPLATPGLSDEEFSLLETTVRAFHGELASWSTDPEVFGLVHCDLHLGNVLFKGGEARAIDFDDSGLSWFLTDLAIATHSYRGARFAELRDALLEGYQETQTLTDDDLRKIDILHNVRHLAMLGWIASRADNPAIYKYLPEARERTLARCRAWAEEGALPTPARATA